MKVWGESTRPLPNGTVGNRRAGKPQSPSVNHDAMLRGMDPAFEKMSPSEQIQHVQDLWDRIAEHPEGVPVSAEMKAELDRRLAAHRADPSTAIPWGQVKAELRRRQ